MASRDVRKTQGGTPGRRTNITSNQYFEPGKVGRKTGITLKDTGLRDDYGLEPMSGIFSSPGSAQRSSYIEDDGSADMEGLDSSMPQVEETIRMRKDPRLPLARATPPRRTNIDESPRRLSLGRAQTQPPYGSPNIYHPEYRRLNFGTNGVRVSIEKQSPFKPRHVLRRSSPGAGLRENRQPQIRSSEKLPRSGGSVRRTSQYPTRVDSDIVTQPQFVDDGQSLFVQQDEIEQDDTLQYSTRDEIEGALDLAESMLHNSSPATSRKRRRTDESASRLSISNAQYTPPTAQITAASSQKRPRVSDLHDEQRIIGNFASQAAPMSNRRAEKMPAYTNQPAPGHGYDDSEDLTASNDQPVADDYYNDDDDNDPDDFDDDVSADLPVAGPSYIEDVDDASEVSSVAGSSYSKDDYEATPPSARSKQPNGRTAKASPQKSRVKIAAPPRRQKSVSDGSDSESNAETSRSKRSGSRSNVQLRATTPFEDAGQLTTRSGRPVMKPLDWWAGEAVIWKNGEVDGVLRANSVEPEKRAVNKKRTAHKKKTKKLQASLGAIDERDEDLLPSEWEDEVGVLTGDVAQWDAELEIGDDNNIVTEDLAFAASSIITRSVVGATFSYAKIQTLPFFGSGVVELPPDGVKTTKNSRKMQMNFFVHKGKVRVTITTPTSAEQHDPAKSSIFNITEGGAWLVPRGNNYTIENISSNSSAFLFFSQGCEIEAADRHEDA